ncbi:CDP-alcohol phosphatidyltransferase family protein [Enterocloster bolteae]|uniref:CDP-alcohol phosphatidyltransferase family protein n=1 Tax=Clostridia TaxID=186801 RepID=UPI000CCEF6AE|nr:MULTISPECIES: CDP-alcohol phosphatidyltransferase family protein [Clostridia]MBS6222972.1 CDP-alcohol phosphatidyltransferase family protein [[Clostridium] symbiosum]MCB6928360.1 CDP-alcohol phosphatidyltransferase family protein [Enterocloster bolteae]PNV63046.1 phosphatidylserine synthase [Clostridium sp. chh4-2]
MLGYYNYTVVLTYMGMLTAFTGILIACDGNINGALVCLMLSGVCDLFDGPIARTRKRAAEEKRFGIQIDSLSDLIGFGVLPGIILYRIAEKSLVGILISAIYVLCALIRLAYFNVMEEKRQDATEDARTCYQGLPVTVSAILIPAVCYIQNIIGIQNGEGTMITMSMMAAAFLIPIKVEKPNFLGKIIISVLGVCGLILLAGGST